MINVNVSIKGAEVVSFNRLEGIKIKVNFFDQSDKSFDFIYKETDPELAVMELMRKLKLYEKRTVKESEDEIVSGVNVMFSEEEKMQKNLARFFTTVNEKAFYINKCKEASNHMQLLQTLLNMKAKF